jgi:hypothetical protein
LPISFQRFFCSKRKKTKKKLAVVILWFIFDSSCASKALKQNLRQTKINNMKTLIKSAIIGLALAGLAQATPSSYVTQNLTQNVSATSSSFTFNQFDSTLGTLSAVDLIINSSTLQGSVTLTRSSGTRIYTDLSAQLLLAGGATLLPDLTNNEYASPALSFLRTPSGDFTMNGANTSRTFTVNGTTQSLIGASPVTLSINSSVFANYTGSGTVLYTSSILEGDENTGTGSTALDPSNLLSPTSLTLRYTYTPSSGPSAVPEPGQVAASLLLLGGIGGYVFIKRRRKSAVAAA